MLNLMWAKKWTEMISVYIPLEFYNIYVIYVHLVHILISKYIKVYEISLSVLLKAYYKIIKL